MLETNGNPVSISTFVDLDNNSDIETRHYVTVSLVIKKSIQCYSKCHDTVGMLTYGSELAVIIIATDLKMEI